MDILSQRFEWTKVIRNHVKELLLSILLTSYYPEADSDIRDKVKVLLDFSSYATEKEVEHLQVLIHLI